MANLVISQRRKVSRLPFNSDGRFDSDFPHGNKLYHFQIWHFSRRYMLRVFAVDSCADSLYWIPAGFTLKHCYEIIVMVNKLHCAHE